MKKTILIMMLAMGIPVVASAQEDEKKVEQSSDSDYKTLFTGSGKAEHGGYGAITPQMTHILDQYAFYLGARGMWLINHKIGLGLGGYMSVNNVSKEFTVDTIGTADLRMGYGGFYFEYIINPNKPVHVTIPILIGGGYANYFNSEEILNDTTSNGGTSVERYFYDRDEYFIIQPGVDLEINMTKFFRLAFNVSYRWFYDLDMLETESNEFDGINAAVSFKFGSY